MEVTSIRLNEKELCRIVADYMRNELQSSSNKTLKIGQEFVISEFQDNPGEIDITFKVKE